MPAEAPYAFGGPVAHALLRRAPEDFFVDEELPFTPDGQGEHLLVQVEKRGHNSAWVGQQLGQHAGIHPRLVSYSGRKDRHAVTRQWFSLQLTGRPDPDWSSLAIEGVRVLASCRHGRKLRTGTHRRNRFVLVLREVDGDRDAIAARLRALCARGFPNAFGEQRFGRDEGTLAMAHAAAAAGRLPRRDNERSLVISALRSEVFNAVLAARVADGSWERLLPGEVIMLDGAQRCFADDGDPGLPARAAALDLHPTGPLPGRGGLVPAGAALALEGAVLARYDETLSALARWQVDADRRALRSPVLEPGWRWLGERDLEFSFTLWRGSFATALLREAFSWRDASTQEDT